MKNIRKSIAVLITLLMVSFTMPSAFAAPDKDGRLFLIQDLRRSLMKGARRKMFLGVPEKIRQGALNTVIMYGGSSTGDSKKSRYTGFLSLLLYNSF